MVQKQNTKKILIFDNEIKHRKLSDEAKKAILVLSEEDKIELLNSAAIANATSASTTQNSLFVYFLLNEKLSKKQRKDYFSKLQRVYDFFEELGYMEKQVYKFGILNRFKTNNPTIEYLKFKTISSNVKNFGEKYADFNQRNKLFSINKFIELFKLNYVKISRILKNKNFFAFRF